MFIIHFKSSNLAIKIFIVFSLLLPFIGTSIIIFSLIQNESFWIYGSIPLGIGIIFTILNYVLAPSSIKKLIDPSKGIKTKNDSIYKFMNIHFERETFTREQFLEYKEHYIKFYSQVLQKINFPFN